MTAATAPTIRLYPRFLVYVDFGWFATLPRQRDLARVGLVAERIGGRLSAWVRAPSKERAREHVAGLLYRAGYSVNPIAITVPISIDGDDAPTPNVVEEGGP